MWPCSMISFTWMPSRVSYSRRALASVSISARCLSEIGFGPLIGVVDELLDLAVDLLRGVFAVLALRTHFAAEEDVFVVIAVLDHAEASLMPHWQTIARAMLVAC